MEIELKNNALENISVNKRYETIHRSSRKNLFFFCSIYTVVVVVAFSIGEIENGIKNEN